MDRFDPAPDRASVVVECEFREQVVSPVAAAAPAEGVPHAGATRSCYDLGRGAGPDRSDPPLELGESAIDIASGEHPDDRKLFTVKDPGSGDVKPGYIRELVGRVDRLIELEEEDHYE